MKENNSDRFEISQKKDILKADYKVSANFFMQKSAQSNFIGITEPIRRINDYDSNLLQEDAYKDIADELFKLEYKMAKTEEQIKNLTFQIQAAHTINDFKHIQNLSEQKTMLERELVKLNEKYNKKSLSARISDSISSTFNINLKNRPTTFNTPVKSIFQKIINNLPKRLASLFELKTSLDKLESINKSVNTLVTSNYPIGESFDKYEQISKYIIQANSIQTKISKKIKRANN